MKKRIFIAFFLIFFLFTVGAGFTVYNLFSITADLHKLINMHEIEDIRQELSFDIQKIQKYIYASEDIFSQQLDEIIAHGERVNKALENCHGCHHELVVEAELKDVESLIIQFQKRLSYLITTVNPTKWRADNREIVNTLSIEIFDRVETMVNTAASKLQRRNAQAMQKIKRSYLLLAITLAITFLMAVVVAKRIIRDVTEPIFKLLQAFRLIKEGNLGHVTSYKARDEFGELFGSFNEMSRSLAEKEKIIQKSLSRLNTLNLWILNLHRAATFKDMLTETADCINDLVDSRQKGIFVLSESKEKFDLHIFEDKTTAESSLKSVIPKDRIVGIYENAERAPLLLNSEPKYGWPLKEFFGADVVENMMIVWQVKDDRLTSALLLKNKVGGDFYKEDADLMGILINNIGIAMENIFLYQSLHDQVVEIEKTQRLLFESEKLTALGTLAGGVAHDFNNILCGMVGHLALLKKKYSDSSEDFQKLDTIEKAGFRAADLTKQLLAFSRRDLPGRTLVNLNECVTSIVNLFEKTVSRRTIIKTELAEQLPEVSGDKPRLEQVIMNLSVNARDALKNGGIIEIRTENVVIDEEESKLHADSQPGEYIKLSVIDNGVGIERETISRIFEPFYTSKEFGNGSGLGLSIVYGIVRSHKGFCVVESEKGKGTAFHAYFPVAEVLFHKDAQFESFTYANIDKTILIVDDEELITKMLSTHLEDIGCKTFIASNGEEALALFNEINQSVDLVILDINMPRMDGREALLEMKAINPDVKVLIATGIEIDTRTRKIINEQADALLHKPFTLQDITQSIINILKIVQ